MAEQKKLSTNDLLEQLRSDTLEKFMSRDVSLPPFHDYITQLCSDSNETREHVIKRSDINRTYGHQLFNGTRRPSRDKVIQLAFGFGMNIEQTQLLLKAAQESLLYPKIKRDAVILYCIMHGADINETQKLLRSFELPWLGD